MTIKLQSDGVTEEWFQLPDDADTKFKIRPLSARERLDVLGIMQGGRVGSGATEALDAALLDWAGVLDDKGQPMRFSKEALQRLPVSAFTAVYKRVLEISTNDEDQRKN